jgi:hypothetical protein
MKRKLLKNVRGETLGYLDTEEDGRRSAKDVRGKLVGRYDPRTDLTYNDKGETQTHGDSLSSLLTKD